MGATPRPISGDQVKVIEGAFASFNGAVEARDLDKQCARHSVWPLDQLELPQGDQAVIEKD